MCGWGTKVSVLRGTTVGNGCVLAANSVVRGDVAPMMVVGGVPARPLKDRVADYHAHEQQRIDIADIARKTAEAARQHATAQGMIDDSGVSAPARPSHRGTIARQ